MRSIRGAASLAMGIVLAVSLSWAGPALADTDKAAESEGVAEATPTSQEIDEVDPKTDEVEETLVAPVSQVDQGDAAASVTPDVVEDPVSAADPEPAPQAVEVAPAPESVPTLSGRGHVQKRGWCDATRSAGGIVLGTTGQALRLEAMNLGISGGSASELSYRVYLQGIGWQAWRTAGQDAGTIGQARRIEAVQIKLTGSLDEQYDVWYRVHTQKNGWMGWATRGASAGTVGRDLRLESVEIRLAAKNAAAPGATNNAFQGSQGMLVESHVQKVGWTSTRGASVVAGTTGRGLRLEALRFTLDGFDEGSGIVANAHVQKVGWQGKRGAGQVVGTTGMARRIEAVTLELTGPVASTHHLYYRVHVQKFGWLGWAKDGEQAGTAGLALRAEAVEIRLVPNSQGAPSNAGSYVSTPFVGNASVSYQVLSGGSWRSAANGGVAGTTGKALSVTGVKASIGGVSGSVSYSAYVTGKGWVSASNGAEINAGANVEAIRVSLSGDAAKLYDVWYCAHSQSLGWMSWACNGQDAGSIGLGKRVEAVRISLVRKGAGAPGQTRCACAYKVSGDPALDVILAKIYRDVTGKGSGALKRAYDYVRGFPYRYGNTWPAGNWSTWSKDYAKEMYNVGSGNCYRYASLMCWLARGLGYDASVYCGRRPSSSSGLVPHGWCEIRSGGTTYILDPNMEHQYPERNWYWQTYDSAPMEYTR